MRVAQERRKLLTPEQLARVQEMEDVADLFGRTFAFPSKKKGRVNFVTLTKEEFAEFQRTGTHPRLEAAGEQGL